MQVQNYSYFRNHYRNEVFSLKVYGEGMVNVQPDLANINLGVSTENIELQKAQQDNREQITKVQTALEGVGINRSDMRTTEYSIYPIYDYSDGKQRFRGYKVDHLLTITVRDLTKIGMVVDTAVANGANMVRNITFSVSNSTAAYNKALSLAVRDAQEKAVTMSNSLGVKLIPTPFSISEILQTKQGPIPFESTPFVKAAATTPIEPGKLEITASVQAVYHYYQ